MVLGRTALSPNIKERRDYSCAVFDARGGLVAQAAHIPVHLGSTPLSVRAAIARVPMEPGDVVVLNDPFAGGTHLPDVTVVAPVFARGARAPVRLRRQPRASRRHRRHVAGLDAARQRHLPGRPAPAAGEARRARPRWSTTSSALFLANTRVPARARGRSASAVGGAARGRRARLRALAARRGGVGRAGARDGGAAGLLRAR